MYQQKGDSAKGGNKFWEGIPDVPFNPRSCFLPVGWGSWPWEMGFRPRTEITSLFASLMGRLTASLSGRLSAFHPPDHKAGGSRHCDGGAHGGEICWESRMLPLGCESRDASGRPSRDASRRSTLQITKPVGLVIVTGVLTVARFVGKVGCYLLVASLSGRLRASLSGHLSAFHPSDHKAGGSRHRDGGAHGGEICWESRSLSGRLRASLSGRLTAFHPPRSQSRWVPSSRRGCSRWRDLSLSGTGWPTC